MRISRQLFVLLTILVVTAAGRVPEPPVPGWPAITRDNKPWTR